MVPICFVFSYTSQDIVDAVRLLNKAQTPRKRALAGWIIIWIVVAVIMFLYISHAQRALRGGTTTSALDPWRILMSPLAMIAFIALVAHLWLRFISPIRVWKRSPRLQQPQSITIDDTGIRLESVNSSTHWNWSAFRRLRETETLFVADLEAPQMLIVPKRALASSAALDELRSVLRTHIAEFAGGFPVLPSS